jgi:hypothetical protein
MRVPAKNGMELANHGSRAFTYRDSPYWAIAVAYSKASARTDLFFQAFGQNLGEAFVGM